VEGIAHWYAVSTWHDIDAFPATTCDWAVRYIEVNGPGTGDLLARPIPRASPICVVDDALVCVDGVSNEWDWASAFRDFRTTQAQVENRPDLVTTFSMVAALYDSASWLANGETDAFWTAFDAAMVSHLGSHHDDWADVAEQWRLER
jgi:hypothetical protein